MYPNLINNLTISTRLIATFAFLLMMVLLQGGLAIESINKLSHLTDKISEHPIKVIDEAQQIKYAMQSIQREQLNRMIKSAANTNPVLTHNVSKMDLTIDNHIDLIKSQYLGNHEDISQLNQAVNNWRHLRDNLLARSQISKTDINTEKLIAEQQEQLEKAEAAIQNILDFAHNQAKSLRDIANAEKDHVITRLSLALLWQIVFGLIITRLITRSITLPLEQLRHRINDIADGDLSVEVPFQQGSTELTAMAHAVQVFKDAILNLENQRWIKSNISELSALLQSTRTPIEFSRVVICELVTQLSGGIGGFYLWDDRNEYLELIGSYGLSQRDTAHVRFKLGEGLVGQCALAHNSILLHNVPEHYPHIISGLGEAAPSTLLITPIIVNDSVLAVIEIGAFQDFSSLQQALIDEVLPLIGLNLEILLRNNKTDVLLNQTQQQSEELRASEEVLREQREELKTANDALEEKTRWLIEQAELLDIARSEADKRALERDTASRYKSEFLANMSHELRTPLNSLLILARSLKDNEEGNLTPDQIESAHVIHDSGVSLLHLINDILDLSKVEAGKMEVVASPILLSQLANALLHRFQALAESNALNFSVKLANNAPEYLYSDAGKLDQILNNLIGNAIKFTENGSVQVDIKPTTHEISEQALAITIKDTGIGIPENKLNLIFHAFEQVDSSISRPYGGTGLGLTISRRLAELLGGKITVESHLNQGSTFTLFLPIGVIAENTALTPVNTVTSLPPTSLPALEPSLDYDDRHQINPADESILIIEDDPHFAHIVRNISRQNGFKCLIAEDGMRGLELAKRYQPTGILLDVGLPRMNGWTVMEQLKSQAETRHIPVHFMSAADCASRGMAMGAIGYFTKPISREQIEASFARIRQFANQEQTHILLVDDDPNTQKAVANLLNIKNIEITSALTGAAALARLENGEHFDCMILDLNLPDISGLNLLETSRQKRLIIPPVIIYTGVDLTEADGRALRNYTDSIITKGAPSTERLRDEVALFLHSVKQNKTEPPKTDTPNPAIIQDLTPHTVLIVDDDMRNTYALAKVLRNKDFNVIMAQDGQKALDQLVAHPEITLILMDIMMPVMDGYTTIRTIRQQTASYQNLPIIALTANAMQGDREKCLAAGADDYLSKPVDIDNLISKIAKLPKAK